MARPYWSGQITISLVSFGVKLFVATEAKGEIHFHQISRKTGERVKYQKVTASAHEAQQSAPDVDTPASAVVEKDEIVKGYEYQKGQYVTIEPKELADLRVPSKHTMEITQFVDESEIDPEFFEKPYFVVPENDAQAPAFAVVRQALRETKKNRSLQNRFWRPRACRRHHRLPRRHPPRHDGIHHALCRRTP